MTTRFRIALCSVAFVLCTAHSGVLAEESHTADHVLPGQGAGLSMTKYYSWDHAKVGTYPGKLVCLRCDLGNAPDAMKQCASEGHRHALSMGDGAMIHPLLAATKELGEQSNSNQLHGKKVSVHGNYYPTTGLILVDEVTVAP